MEKYKQKELITVASSRSGHNFIVNNLLTYFKGGEYIHRNFENSDPQQLTDIPYIYDKDNLKVVILRDYLNLIASLVKFWQTQRNYDVVNTARLYIPMAQEYLGHTNHLNKDAGIYYDHFKKSVVYRKSIAKQLGGEYNSSMLEVVPKNGGASSFDQKRYDGKGSKMATLDRWLQVFRDPELCGEYLRVLRETKNNVEFYRNNFYVDKEKSRFLKFVIG